MIEENIAPILEISLKIMEEAKKIIENKKVEDYTEEDIIKINIALKLGKLAKEIRK